MGSQAKRKQAGPQLNQFQRLALETYEGGEFAHIDNEEDASEAEGLLSTIVGDLGNAATKEDALRIMGNIRRQLDEVREAIANGP